MEFCKQSRVEDTKRLEVLEEDAVMGGKLAEDDDDVDAVDTIDGGTVSVEELK